MAERRGKKGKRTSQRFELITHPLQLQPVTCQVLTNRKLERRRVARKLELAALSERMHERGVEEESLHRKAGEVERPATSTMSSVSGKV